MDPVLVLFAAVHPHKYSYYYSPDAQHIRHLSEDVHHIESATPSPGDTNL